MDRRVTQPTKEQVRAYMVARGQAKRPPPAPEEIRRQLGWQLAPPDPPCALAGWYMFPATLGQCAVQFVIDWCLAPLRARPGATGPGKKMRT